MKGSILQRPLLRSYSRYRSFHNSCHHIRSSVVSYRLPIQQKRVLQPVVPIVVTIQCRAYVSNNRDRTIHSTSSTKKDASSSLTIVQYPSNTFVTEKDEQHRSVGNRPDHHKYKYGTKATVYYVDSAKDVTDAEWSNHRWKRQHQQQQQELDHRKSNDDNSIPSRFRPLTQIRQLLYDTILVHFVPVQYPASVQQPGYTRYAIYSFVAAVAGSASMVISTQILLSTIFTVTPATSTTSTTAATAGALNWVMKDGIGQLGGIIVASQMGHYHAFDNNPKRYRMYAALLLDVAAFIEICTPLLCLAFGSTIHSPITMIVLPSACIATVCKNIGYIMASASRATLHQSLCIHSVIDPASTITNTSKNTDDDNIANEQNVSHSESVQYHHRTTTTNNNLADVTAKFGSQGTAAGLIGTIIGISVSASTNVWNDIVTVATLSSNNSVDLQQYYSMIGFLLFIVTHIIQVARAGWNNFRAMVAGYEIEKD